MNKFSKIFEGNWDEIKGKVKKQWGKLTENDLKQIDGSYDEFLGALKKAYGYSTAEVENEVSRFINSDKFEDLKQNAVELKENLTGKALEIKEAVKESLNEYLQNIKDKTVHTEEAVVAYIKANPLKAAGIAALAGIALSYVFKSKKD